MSDRIPAPEPHQPIPLLDKHLCFTLYAASRAITGVYRPLLEPLGLTYPQYLVMVTLGEHRTLTVKELVALLQLDYGTVTPLIKRLEANGLLQRQRQAADERVVHVALTEEGLALHARLSSIPPAIGEAAGLTAEEVSTLQSLARRLTANIDDHTAAGKKGDRRT
ncbi:MarR family transcriptional regulator [Streptomyces sp. NBC_01341]|uniref:MarR family winged helix-turn-helix transcriptional regulator n=1 Tax=Streptomyces sp. NBC_01341 TaxID=2903831 RepID=UPI002E11FC2B|nr:MarR family transcriptional regulator [Streptomyces sp. NBC_01341]